MVTRPFRPGPLCSISTLPPEHREMPTSVPLNFPFSLPRAPLIWISSLLPHLYSNVILSEGMFPFHLFTLLYSFFSPFLWGVVVEDRLFLCSPGWPQTLHSPGCPGIHSEPLAKPPQSWDYKCAPSAQPSAISHSSYCLLT